MVQLIYKAKWRARKLTVCCVYSFVVSTLKGEVLDGLYRRMEVNQR